MQKIQTPKGIIEFEPQKFVVGSQKIDKETAKENLFLFQEIMEKHNIKFSLAYGTLLGAVREKDFISHDEDIDVAILDEDREKFLSALFDLQKKGFIVGRYEKDLLSIIRKGEYIDVYIFKKKFLGYRQFNNEILKEKYLLDTISYEFLGREFDIPKDYIEYLEEHYGKNWKIPVVGMHACNPGVYLKIKKIIYKKSKKLYFFLSTLKKILNVKNI